MKIYFLNSVQLSCDFGKVVPSGTTQGKVCWIPLADFFVARDGYVVVFVVPTMTIIQLEECWEQGTKRIQEYVVTIEVIVSHLVHQYTWYLLLGFMMDYLMQLSKWCCYDWQDTLVVELRWMNDETNANCDGLRSSKAF
jgi:hypothetical protein